MAKAFVTGWPVEHSLSPLIHNYWIKAHQLTGNYSKRPCAPQEFEHFAENFSLEGFVGGNVTIPHKEAACKLAKVVDETARQLGAANTLWLHDNLVHATNTDGYGFLSNLDEFAPGWDGEDKLVKGALVVGAGGAARAIIHALVSRGFEKIWIANRTITRANELIADLRTRGMTTGICETVGLNELPEGVKSAAIIVNTTSVGMAGGAEESQSPVSLDGFSKGSIVNDIVYTPLQTPILLEAEHRGLLPVDGLGMLLHQAVPGFEKWFGVRPQVTAELRNLILDTLASRANS